MFVAMISYDNCGQDCIIWPCFRDLSIFRYNFGACELYQYVEYQHINRFIDYL